MNKVEFKAAMSDFRSELNAAHKEGFQAFSSACDKKFGGIYLSRFLKQPVLRPVSIKVMFALESRGILPANFDADRVPKYN